ncbi:hypothetical protein LWI28_000092 [Acer negundo]|uniref:Protein At-4/1-like n=1 Tax=Acer negundo TaxID=4023 RepID=A0AAD5NY63_ACENE|nr:hypothetical protein LWI28_000092 [Acer negundo]
MAANSEEEMEWVLSSFDQIYEEFKNGIMEIQLLRSNCNAEIKKREALEFSCKTLKQDNERMKNCYKESLNDLADQLDYHSKYQSLKEELKRVTDEHLSKENELRKAIDLLKQECAAKLTDFEAQIRGLLHEKATNEATINHLRQDLASHKTHMQALTYRLDQVHFDIESKYNLEIQDLKDCLLLEREEKNELHQKFRELEKELLISRTKLVEQHRDSTSIQNVETLKLKMMKLRKENEILKRKLSCSEER